MSNDFICDPAGVTSNARRIKDYGAVITSGFGRLDRPGWMNGRLRWAGCGWRRGPGPCDDWGRRSGFVVDLLARYIGPDEQAGIVCS